MSKLNIGKDLYLKGRIGWQGLSKDEYLVKSDYKIINATALMDGYVDWNNCGYITKERYDEAKEIQLQENDILISKDGTLGKIGYVKNLTTPCSVASGIFVLRNTKPDLINFDYLYHVLKSPIFKDFIKRNKAQGSTIPHLYQRDLENFEIEIPNFETQTKISNVLNLIEKKIAINNQIIDALVSLSKTLYDYWFLQFEFPNDEGKPYKSSGEKMVWNEVLNLEIPEGWSVVNIGEIADLYQPKTISGNEILKDGKYLVYGANGIVGKYNDFNHNDNTIAICCRGASCGEFLMTLPYSWITGNAMVVEPKDKIYKEFIYYGLSKDRIRPFISGSAQPQITRSNLENLKVIIPKRNIIFNFNTFALDIRKKIQQCLFQNIELESIKDFILPLLMNGQLSFKE
ncbi:MAG TPA: restriction endonuclease subunit S [Acholeplasmataceae bacterium]|nr:restriction endonuclease subunit S [Acholeplasmataceae bacterium]